MNIDFATSNILDNYKYIFEAFDLNTNFIDPLRNIQSRDIELDGHNEDVTHHLMRNDMRTCTALGSLVAKTVNVSV